VGGNNVATPGYINHGSFVAVFKISVNGLDLAVRLNRYNNNPPYTDFRAQVMARTLGIECTEQGYAYNPTTGIMVSHFVDGERHYDRGARGGLWLFAGHVAKLVQAQDKFLTLNTQRDDGNQGNILVGADGLTFVDMLPGNNRAYYAKESLIPELMSSFLRPQLHPPFDTQQEQELRAIINIFKKRFPNSDSLPFLRQILSDYGRALEA
jgi:hypothetical protein